ncbi:glycosyltransferase involved in cell wall biosynthesis [Microvirga flocculans]|uniref:Glycosyltransferase involved in cell wall biosynthesis n=1 Tax=Microvirga flocculans TaxID=217168 RepID=A0A7W6IH77_9HYPH|nr:glycosyltransferase [Microvirga flocculans]MBB4040795.1 glycosyltransferase involved in cell wall biosynthesis [Microvirga flocculans]
MNGLDLAGIFYKDDEAEMVPSRSMNVVLIIDDLAIGGAQRVFEVQLRTMLNGPYSIRVINLSGPTAASERIRALGIDVVDVQQRKLFDLSSWKRLRSLIQDWRPQIVHAHLNHATITGALLSRLSGARFVVTLHSQGPKAKEWRTYVKNALERAVLCYGSDHIVACGPRVARMQRKRVGHTPMSVIQNRIEPPPPLPREERYQVRSSFGYDSEDLVVISVGRLIVGKGFDILIKAFRGVVHRYPKAKLIIVGGGNEHNHLLQVIHDERLGAHVQLTGSRSDVGRLMAASDIFVLPSLWEGLPMTLLEAMAAGLPVIATDVGDISTVIGDGAGIIVKPGDEQTLAQALCELLREPEIRICMSEKSKSAVREYIDLDAFSNELRAVYFEDADGSTTHDFR